MHDLPDIILTRYTDRAAAIAAERCREQDANDTEWANAESRMRATRKIVTTCICPPIPDRSHDWCAHYDGEEEAGGYGYGTTEAEAVQDFIDNCQADHDERLARIAFPEAGQFGAVQIERRV
ncbi:MAG TPA: hypothetical protein VFT69_16960 [Pseudolabrys sp.]|nr:hypothetical protein [Pseudolabrys sp.]